MSLQEALETFRPRCFELGLPLRPTLFETKEDAETQKADENTESGAQSTSPEQPRLATQKLYLATSGGVQGVLQLHKALDDDMEGYAYMWRTHEIWPEQQGSQLSAAWKVDIGIHFIRRDDYRGKADHVPGDRPRLPFDALTTPGFFFAVGVGLQVRGCKPELQLAALQALEVVLSACVPPDLDLDLLPGRSECARAACFSQQTQLPSGIVLRFDTCSPERS
ncbi:unnamed protein product [Symbiodinium natans]|uniref:Uncharacterized protein n=1 Tax=Symbiodinium natans TaxID=878477 RepID=A0A812LZD6_9DINO|nr:unnamed protein product [Symbiodinium natans]